MRCSLRSLIRPNQQKACELIKKPSRPLSWKLGSQPKRENKLLPLLLKEGKPTKEDGATKERASLSAQPWGDSAYVLKEEEGSPEVLLP